MDVSAPGGFDAGSRATELGVHERDGDAHRAIMCPSPPPAARVLNEEALLGKEVTERKYLPGHVKGGSIFLELSVTVHPRGCIAAAMTTIWRPHWLVKHIEPVKEEVPDDDVPDVKVEPVADDDGINGEDGTTPSEGKGAKRKRAPKTKGPCEHGVKYRSKCKVCSACPHGRRRSQCKECGGQESASTVVGAQMQGVRWGCNLRARSSALLCKECGGGAICEHGRQRSQCKECGGASICEHGRIRSKCKECGGGSICEHGRSALMQGVRW